MSQSTLQARLDAHITQVQEDPSVQLDEGLFKQAETFLAVELFNTPNELLAFITRLSSLLQALQQDPSPVTSLLSKLVEPFSFTDVLNLSPAVDFLAGLDLSAVPFNSLVLQLLHKASRSPKDVAILANMPEVVLALVRLFLCTPEMGIAEKAADVMIDLLRADKEDSDVPTHGVGDDSHSKAGGQGLFWRRVFGDKDVYGSFFSICSLKIQAQTMANLGKRERTVAQARLLALLPRIGQLDWHYLTRSHHAEIERSYGLSEGEGLLDFACLYMVDTKDDVLIHMNLLQFFADLISLVRTPTPTEPQLSVALSYLIRRGLHTRAMSFWLNPDDPAHDPVDLTFLYGPSSKYLSVFASTYPSALLNSPEKPRILQRLSQTLSISANSWAHGQSPKHDLNVLISLPRISLLPDRQVGTGRQSSPLLLVPTKNTNEDALHALAVVLHGPEKAVNHELVYGANGFQPALSREDDVTEAAIAYALYLSYLHYHDTLYVDLIAHADTVALPEKALAAINLLAAVASANYAPLPADPTHANFTASSSPDMQNGDQGNTSPPHPPTTPDPLTTQHLARLLNLRSPSDLPQFHRHPLLTSPSARDRVLPWLLRPPQTFTNLVGGRGDPESSAYKIATAKWDLLVLVRKRLEQVTREGDEEGRDLKWMMDAIDVRMREGVWGAQPEAGGRVATLDL